MEMKRRLICEKWQREDAPQLSEERETDSFAIFQRRSPHPTRLTYAPQIRARSVSAQSEPEAEEIYRRPPVVLPPNPSAHLKAQLEIDVQERLMAPRRIPQPVQQKSPLLGSGDWDKFLGRQAELESQRRARELAQIKPEARRGRRRGCLIGSTRIQ
jgi:hypothetical protein